MSFVSVVTGGSSGIGRAIAVHLSRRGQLVLAVARKEEKLGQTLALGEKDKIVPVKADVTTEAGRAAVVQAVKESGKKVKYLVQNAGTIGQIDVAVSKNFDEKAWKDAYELNVHAPLFLVNALDQANLFDVSDSGARILHIGSKAAHVPVHGWSAYCSTKAAFFMLARCLQLEFESQGKNIAVSSVQPGIVESPMQETIRTSSTDQMKDVERFKSLKANEYSGQAPDEPHEPPSDGLDTAANAAHFCHFLLTEVSSEEFAAKEFDIRDPTMFSRWIKK